MSSENPKYNEDSAAKRHSMTASELQFVNDVLDNPSLGGDDEELKIFLASSNADTANTNNRGEGSKKRQEILEKRRRQSMESCERAAKLSKTALLATKTVAIMNSSTKRPSGNLNSSFPRRSSINDKRMSVLSIPEEDSNELKREDEEQKEKEAIAKTKITTSEDADTHENSDNEKAGEMRTCSNVLLQNNRREVFLRQASANIYDGEGIEIGNSDFSSISTFNTQEEAATNRFEKEDEKVPSSAP